MHIWLTFYHLYKTIKPSAQLCSFVYGIPMVMLARLKFKLKSCLNLWIYTELASNLGGKFTSGALVVVRLP